MGYRSDLYALVHGKDLLNFSSALKEHDLHDCFDEIQEQDSEGYTRFKSNTALKWYERSYPGVIAVDKVFQDSDLSVMLRVGEAPGDTEFIGNSELGENTFDITITVEVEF